MHSGSFVRCALLTVAAVFALAPGALAQIRNPAPAPAVTVVDGPIQVDPSGIPAELGAPTSKPPVGT